MRVALYVVALVADILAILLLLLVLAFGHMPTGGVITAWVFVAILALNAVAVFIGWRTGSAKPDQSAIVNTFS
jgi:Kef-type K+ transport system membrane component KefB